MEYEEVSLIKQSDRCTVHLIYEKCEGHFFVRKVLVGEQRIYQKLQGCSHPCLPKLYNVTIADGVTTIIEEYIEGQSLGIVSISKKQFQSVVKDLCSALEYLHGMGIIHRDIKPSNIIFREDGHICLIDFDAARMPKDDLEQDTRLLGTRGYAPPEQYGFSQTDARADIYSLGVTLNQIMENQIYKRYYKRVIKKCMNLNPDKRYQTIRQVKKAFFPAKRNACCILIVLLLAILSRKYIEIISNNTMEDVDPIMLEEINTYPDEILFHNSQTYEYLGRQIEDIMDEMGVPVGYSEGGGVNWCSYLGIEFEFDAYREVYNITLDTVNCTYNGQMLNKNRDKLIDIVGNPSEEGWVNIYDRDNNEYMDVYCMDYENFDENINVIFYLMSPDERAYAVVIW